MDYTCSRNTYCPFFFLSFDALKPNWGWYADFFFFLLVTRHHSFVLICLINQLVIASCNTLMLFHWKCRIVEIYFRCRPADMLYLYFVWSLCQKKSKDCNASQFMLWTCFSSFYSYLADYIATSECFTCLLFFIYKWLIYVCRISNYLICLLLDVLWRWYWWRHEGWSNTTQGYKALQVWILHGC